MPLEDTKNHRNTPVIILGVLIAVVSVLVSNLIIRIVLAVAGALIGSYNQKITKSFSNVFVDTFKPSDTLNIVHEDKTGKTIQTRSSDSDKQSQ